MRGEQAIFNHEIKKKSGLSINPDIHHSKVFSFDQPKLLRAPLQIHLSMELLDINVTQGQCINVYIHLFA